MYHLGIESPSVAQHVPLECIILTAAAKHLYARSATPFRAVKASSYVVRNLRKSALDDQILKNIHVHTNALATVVDLGTHPPTSPYRFLYPAGRSATSITARVSQSRA
jgi:hypothetical protein